MRFFFRAALVITYLVLVSVQGAFAFNISHMTIDPSGSLTPGTPVVVCGTINIVSSIKDNFPSTHELRLNTDLEKPKWSWTLILKGEENPRPAESGRMLSLSGFELSYPQGINESLRIDLKGITPKVNQTLNKTLMRIQELNEKGNVIANSTIEYSVMVINPEPYPQTPPTAIKNPCFGCSNTGFLKSLVLLAGGIGAIVLLVVGCFRWKKRR